MVHVCVSRCVFLLFITISITISVEGITSANSTSTAPDTPAAMYTVDTVVLVVGSEVVTSTVKV